MAERQLPGLGNWPSVTKKSREAVTPVNSPSGSENSAGHRETIALSLLSTSSRPTGLCEDLIKHNKEESNVRAKKPSLTQSGDQRLKGDIQTTTAGQAGCLQGQDCSAVTHPSIGHPRRCLTRLFAITFSPTTLG
ncbi:hypothetical protein J6590_066788 [Homalodisca vitripennis]|nr:hypothetical protein J6590_066788 [Homalodisca vitripennis]